MRDRVRPGEGLNIFLRAGRKPPKGLRPGNPGTGYKKGFRQAALKRSVGGRRQPGPAQPAAPEFLHFGQNGPCPAVSSAPALWFGANAGARAFGAERSCGRRGAGGAGGDGVGRRPVELSEVRVFANGPIETALTLWGGSRNSRVNRSIWASRR